MDLRIDYDLENEAYHAHPNFGSTSLKRLRETLANFWTRPSYSSRSLSVGSDWHYLLEIGIEPFRERVVIIPDEHATQSGEPSKRPAAKAWLAGQADDAIPVTAATMALLERMHENFMANSAARMLYESVAMQEVSIFWNWLGVPVKARPDALTKSGVLVDWKSTSEVAPLKTFWRSVLRYGYGLSAALYREGCRVADLADSPMVFVATSTVSCETQVLTLPSAYEERERADLMELLKRIDYGRQTGTWTPEGYGTVHVMRELRG